MSGRREANRADGAAEAVSRSIAPPQRAPRDSEPVPQQPLEIPRGLSLYLVVNEVHRGTAVADEAFDTIYPKPVRERSERFWTPVDVARRAAELLVVDSTTRVLDVGAGAGKFCLVGALTTEGDFTGVEQRGHLVAMARQIARYYGVRRANYVHDDANCMDWRPYDAFYFFNPFAENYFADGDQIDHTVDLSPERFHYDVGCAVAGLASAKVGTRVVTYHGLGRTLPNTYDLHSSESAGSDALELWVRARI